MTNALHAGRLLGAIMASALLTTAALAQDYPNRPITMIVPFAVGGLTDVPARVLAGMLQEKTGQTIVVENKPGGSGTLGGSYAVRAKPDGYTLFANSIADAQNLWFLPVPYNAIDVGGSDPYARGDVAAFVERLVAHGLRPHLRYSGGAEVAAACGQLAGQA